MRRWFVALSGFLVLGTLMIILMQAYLEIEGDLLGFIAHLSGFVAATIFISVCVSLSLRLRTQAQQSQRRVEGRKRRPWFAFLLGFFVLGALSVLLMQLYVETEAHHLGFLAHLLGFLAVAMFIWSSVQFSLLSRTPVPASQRRLLNGIYIPGYWRRRPRH